MISLNQKVFRFVGLTLLASLVLAWDLPRDFRALKLAQDESAILDYVILSVNGRTKKVSNGDELSYVRGDILKVVSASLRDPKKPIAQLRIPGLGFKGSVEVRNSTVDTSIDLVGKEGALDPTGAVYALVASSREVLHGAIFLHRLEPALSYIDITVNGKNRVMREGEVLKLKKSDHFKITKMVTNIKDNKEISFAVIPLLESKPKEFSDKQNYQIVFKHKSRMFAKIPLTVENL